MGGRVSEARAVRLRHSVSHGIVGSLTKRRTVSRPEEGRIETTGVGAEVSVVRPESTHILTVTQVLVLGLVETEEISDSSFCGSGNLGTELSDQRTG
tara:strand:- start:33 stop:323 length:291 start_codon:yes stop_codon:yes gene_type:complete